MKKYVLWIEDLNGYPKQIKLKLYFEKVPKPKNQKDLMNQMLSCY